MTKQERVAMGQRLRQQRNRLGLTREQFAELADIGTGYYGQIEVGTSQMSIDTLMKVARTSRLSMEYILFGEEGGETDLGSLETLLSPSVPKIIPRPLLPDVPSQDSCYRYPDNKILYGQTLLFFLLLSNQEQFGKLIHHYAARRKARDPTPDCPHYKALYKSLTMLPNGSMCQRKEYH